MNRFIFVMMLLCLTASLFAQTGSLKGVVTTESGQPLAGADVYIKPLSLRTFTDPFGVFYIDKVPTGEHDITITYLGFEAATENVSIRDGERTIFRVKLSPGTLTLADVVIAGSQERRINTISQVDINLRPIQTSQDILRMVPGLFIAQHAGGGKAEQIFLRGFDIDHGTDINLEVDGLPVNMVSHAHGQGYSDLHFVIPELIDHVDFNKGPYYAGKGNFTTAGYASFNTKNYLEENMIKVEGGRFGTFRNVNGIRIVGDADGRQSLYVASEYYRTDGYFDSHQHFNRLNLTGKYTLKVNDNQNLVIGLSTFNSRWDASGQIPHRAMDDGAISRFGAIDNTEGGETSRTNAYIRLVHATPDGSRFENQLYFTKYDFYLVSNFTFFLNDPVSGDQITQSESRNIYGYRGSYTKSLAFGSRMLQSEIGGGFRYDDVNDIHLYNTISRKTFVADKARGDIDETNLYAYVNETLDVTDKFTVNASVRLDHFTFNYVDALDPRYERQSISKAMISPKLQLHYAFNDNTELYLKSGTGFHSNDTRVVVARNGEDILPKAYSVDFGTNIKLGDKLLINAALWAMDLEQEFVYVGDEGIVEPGGETRRVGIDLSVRYQITPWLFFDTDLNVTDPKSKSEPEGTDHIPLAPTFTSIGGLSFRFKNGINGSIRYRFMDDRPANEDNSVVAKGYTLFDAVLKYTRKNFEVNVVAENITDQQWNEAQFDTESRLLNEADPVSEIHFTPGTPFFFKAGISFFF